MTREPLGRNEILQLSNLLKRVFEHIQELRRENPLANKIQMPKIPPILTESICCQCAPFFFGPNWEATLGGSYCDVLLQRPTKRKKIEVKATGKSQFEYFSRKDLAADYLIWINFGDFFERGTSLIEVYILKKPSSIFPSPTKVTLEKFKKLCKNRGLRQFNVLNIEEMLEGRFQKKLNATRKR